MKVTPFDDKVLVKPREQSEKIDGSVLFKPGTVEEITQIGTVLAVGSGRLLNDGTRSELTCKPGDVVMFVRDSGINLKVKGDNCLLLSGDHLLASLELDECKE